MLSLVFMTATAVSPSTSCCFNLTSTLHEGYTVAKFAGENVHKRLVTEETYQQKQYESAMKRAFLGTDEDLRAG